MSCGQGDSCAGQCSSLGASLCPSANCTDDPRDCLLDFDENLDEHELVEANIRGRRGATSTSTSQSLNWCKKDGCKVRQHPECCFVKKCEKSRPKTCKWLNNYSGL